MWILEELCLEIQTAWGDIFSAPAEPRVYPSRWNVFGNGSVTQNMFVVFVGSNERSGNMKTD